MTDQNKPNGWISCQLGAVLTLINGRAYKKPEMLDAGTPILRIQNLNGGENWFYSDLDLPEDKYCEKGDLLYAWSATFGPYWSRWDHKLVFHYHIWKILPSEAIDKRFAYYELLRITEDLKASAHGVAMPHITKSGMESWSITLPSLAEQKAIADKLDTLLAQVENTKARLERIPQILKRFRQSVLAAAVSGRLTEEWRPHSGSYVHSLAEDWKWTPVPETWEVKLYPDLVESRLGKMLDKAKNSGLPTKYLGNINVRWFDFNLSEVQEILVSEAERNELSIRAGDVLICEGGEPGRCAIWDGRVEEQMVFQKALHRARVSDALLPEWLALNLKHDADSLTLEQLFTGTTIKHLTGKALKKYPLRVPPIKEQTEIVRRVDQLLAHADRIEQQVNNALARVNNLTQSILAKAFRGELTEQWRKDNPELISGENSAEALLERVQAERAAMKPVKKTRSKPTTV